MNNLLRLTFAACLLGCFAATNFAQEGQARAELECLMMTQAGKVATAGEKGRYPTFHHVWSPDMQYGFFNSNGLQLPYNIEGVGNETIIVVPGGPGLPQEYLHPMLSNLTPYTNIVYFDRRADILSSRALHQVLSPEEIADDVDALRRELGLKRVTLLGHSFGGVIALTYAKRYPENIKRLLLLNTAAEVEHPSVGEQRLQKMLSASEVAMMSSGDSSLSACERVRRHYRALFPHYFYLKPNAKQLDDGVYAIYFDALAKKLFLANHNGAFDLRGSLNSINVPVLVVGGRHDAVTPLSQVRDLAASLPNAKLVVMEHSGHFPFVEENYLLTQWVQHFMLASNDGQGDIELGKPKVLGADGSR